MRISRVVAALLLSATSALAGEHFECATSEKTNEQVRQLDAWTTAREQTLLSKGTRIAPNASVRSNIIVLPADDLNAPFRHRFDLAGRSLELQRAGTQSFNVTNVALAYDADRGTELKLPPGQTFTQIPLTKFRFPFFDREVTSLFISEFNGIFLDTPAPNDVGQFGDLELLAQQQAVIAPLLTTVDSQFGQIPTIYVKETDDALTVTWTTTGSRLDYDVQARLSRNGDIRFSYRGATSIFNGGVIVTSGRESWRTQRNTIVTIGDNPNDVNVRVPAAAAAMLDIENMTVSRLGDSDVIEARIKLRAPLDTKLIGGASDYVAFFMRYGNSTQSSFYVYGDGSSEYYAGAWGGSFSNPGARIEGDTIVLTILQSLISPWAGKMIVQASTYMSSAAATADTSIIDMKTDAARIELRTDFTNAARTIDGPIYEAFTVPIISTVRTWKEVKDLYRLRRGRHLSELHDRHRVLRGRVFERRQCAGRRDHDVDERFAEAAAHARADAHEQDRLQLESHAEQRRLGDHARARTSLAVLLQHHGRRAEEVLAESAAAASRAVRRHARRVPSAYRSRRVVHGRRHVFGGRERIHDAGVHELRLQLARPLSDGPRGSLRGAVVVLHRELESAAR
jgi:hypothetical protein